VPRKDSRAAVQIPRMLAKLPRLLAEGGGTAIFEYHHNAALDGPEALPNACLRAPVPDRKFMYESIVGKREVG
jgi:hypothetical protein